MNKYNICIMRGQIGRDHFYGKTSKDKSYLKFSISTQNEGRTKDSKKTYSWHQCMIWGELADIMKDAMIEGAKCIVVGSYVSNIYVNKSGHKVTSQQIKVDSIDFVVAQISEVASEAARFAKNAEEEFDEGDLPI